MPAALEGVRVLDLSQGAAGPIAGMMLGEYGATVVKVDPPGGEWGRGLGPPFIEGQAAAYCGMNRGKRSLVVNLKHPDGPAVVRELAQRCDVLLESFRPGVLDRLGVGYAALSADHPTLVYCAITAFGQDGPWRDKPGVDGIVQAMSGIMSVTGERDGGPVKVGVPAADTLAGVLAAQGVLLALLARARSGRGQRVDVSLFDAMLMFQTVPWSMFLASGESPGRQGSAAPYAAPNEAYPTADGHIMIAAYWPDRWRRLLAVLELEALAADPRFATVADRVAHRAELGEQLAGRLRTRTTAAWLAALEAEDIVCAPILDYAALAQHPEVMTPERFPAVTHPVLGPMPGVGMPARLSATPAAPGAAAPLAGEQTTEILAEMGVPATRIRGWLESGAVSQWRRPGEGGETAWAS